MITIKPCKFYIYKITNTINGKIYIGKSKNPQKRWRTHVYDAKGRNKKRYFYLQKSINKYGSESFKMEIIDEFDDEKTAYEKEIEWISFYKSTDHETGMNLSAGGEGMPRSEITEEMMVKWKSKKLSPEHIQKLKEVNSKPKSEAFKKMVSERQMGEKNHRYGKKLSEEHKKILSEFNTGKKMSEETKRILSEKGKIRMAENPLPKEVLMKISAARKGIPSEFGENHHAAKLTESDVIELKRLHCCENMSFKQLSEMFKINPDQVRRIIRRERWKHISDYPECVAKEIL